MLTQFTDAYMRHCGGGGGGVFQKSASWGLRAVNGRHVLIMVAFTIWETDIGLLTMSLIVCPRDRISMQWIGRCVIWQIWAGFVREVFVCVCVRGGGGGGGCFRAPFSWRCFRYFPTCLIWHTMTPRWRHGNDLNVEWLNCADSLLYQNQNAFVPFHHSMTKMNNWLPVYINLSPLVPHICGVSELGQHWFR